jgi:hypothetical protein
MPGLCMSVIVVVYEQISVASLVLDSLSHQDFTKPWELIICDDGSRSDVRGVIVSCSFPDNVDVRYVWQPHEGRRVGRSRNNGIRCAQGDILVFIDGDSVVPVSFLTTHFAAHQNDIVLFCGSRRLVFTESTLLPSSSFDFLSGISGPPPIVDFFAWQMSVYATEPWRVCMGCNMSVRRSPAVWFNEFFIGWGAEDVELACRLWKRHQYKIVIEPPAIVYSVETSSIDTYSVIRPQTHDEIRNCIHDLFHLEWMYPDIDLSSLIAICRFFDYDQRSAGWKRASADTFAKRAEVEAVDRARAWLESVPYLGDSDIPAPHVAREDVRAVALHRGDIRPPFQVKKTSTLVDDRQIAVTRESRHAD